MDWISEKQIPVGKCKIITSGYINNKIFAYIEDKSGNIFKVNEEELIEYVPDHCFKLPTTCWLDSDEYGSCYQYGNGIYKAIEYNDFHMLSRIFKRLSKTEQKTLLLSSNFYKYSNIDSDNTSSYTFESFFNNKNLNKKLPKNTAFEYVKTKFENFKKTSKIFYKKTSDLFFFSNNNDMEL
ncbi:MAG: hypothetical protein IJS74_03055 [Clostridia bacterium]|nr:hypothetical protein [Clostridia bacterium]